MLRGVEPRLAGLVDLCQRHAWATVLTGGLLAFLGITYAASHLGLSSETDRLFSSDLPWRQRAAAFKAEFPQFQDLLVAVIDAREPEEAEATAASLTEVLAADHEHFQSVRRPDASPFFRREGMLLLERSKLEETLNRIIDAQPFLGELTKDPSARGLFSALSLAAAGVEQEHADLEPHRSALTAFHNAIKDAVAGHPHPLSWVRLLAGELADPAGSYKFVLAKPRLDHTQMEFSGAAARTMRGAAAGLEFVKSGEARVRITGNVVLAEEEFATVAQGTVEGMIVSVLLITVWLFLAVRTWRLIIPILLALALGTVLTLFFAALAVGTLNLISVGFSILFVGIAVDFAIQFSVRYREQCQREQDTAAAMTETGRRAGRQILVAAIAISAGFLSFVPTDFRGVAELGLIAGVGMLIAAFCTMTFLPAAIAVFRRSVVGEREIGFAWAAPLDKMIHRHARWLLILFGIVGCIGMLLLPWLSFDANPLHTKNANTEAMRTLEDLRSSPFANPFTADILVTSPAEATALSSQLTGLPLVSSMLSINSFVPSDQPEKLALIQDAKNLLSATLVPRASSPRPGPDQIRAAVRKALTRFESILPESTDAIVPVLTDDLRVLAAAPDDVLVNLDQTLTRFLPAQLDSLRDALQAESVSLETIPAELSRDWLLPGGGARIQVVPTPDARTSEGLAEFVMRVQAIAPDATGPAPTIIATSETITHAFRFSMVAALVVITMILVIELHRLLDVALVLAPLLLSSLMTITALVLLRMPLNYANIIVLPLVLGVGVSFNIYFVMNWRAGQRAVLASATARAVLFSALTTGSAFGSLALSRHPGTASMGWLLLTTLCFTLAASFVFLPALLTVASARKASGRSVG